MPFNNNCNTWETQSISKVISIFIFFSAIIVSVYLLYICYIFSSIKHLVLPIFAALFVFLSAWGAGRFASNIFHLKTEFLEKVLSGYFLISLYVIVIGSFSLLYPFLIIFPLVVFSFYSFGDIQNISKLKNILDELKYFYECRYFLFLFIIAVTLSWLFMSVCTPPIGMDALTYHLNIPQQFIINRSIIPPDNLGYYFYFLQHGMIMIPLLILDPMGIASNITGFIFLICLLHGAYLLAKNSGEKGAGIIAVSAIVSSPVLIFVLLHTKDDILTIASLVWGVYSWYRADIDDSPQGKHKYELWGAVFIGASIAVKPTSFFIAGPAYLIRLFYINNWKTKIFSAVSISIFPSYWGVRNILMVKSVLAPNIVETLPTASASGMSLNVIQIEKIISNVNNNITHLTECFFQFVGLNIDGPLGAFLLFLTLTGFLVHNNRVNRIIAVSGIMAIVIWLIGGRSQARFLLPAFSLLAINGSVFIINRGKLILLITLLLAIVTSGSAIRRTFATFEGNLFHLGVIDIDNYIARRCNSYFMLKEFNKIQEKAPFLFSIGESRLFYLKHKVCFDGYWERSRALDEVHKTHSPEILWKKLKDAGFTHLLYNEPVIYTSINQGFSPLPLCPKDTETVRAMISSETYCEIINEEIEKRTGNESLLGLYKLK